MTDDGGAPRRPLTFLQRRQLASLVKEAHKHPGEPLSPDDWEAYFRFAAQPRNRAGKRLLRALPSTPRCGFCGAPFAGIGGALVRPLGFRPSRKNPSVCATCVELAPPGGTTLQIGVLFADLRGFTTRAESLSPVEVGALLRRFYGVAEKVLFPEAVIDKLIGDEVMALYLPSLMFPSAGQDAELDAAHLADLAGTMLGHARELLVRSGYGSEGGPAWEIGIGLDFGEAFVGNIGGDAAVHDFTAVGDVVNTTSRLQGQAASGDVVLSERFAALLEEPVGVPERLELKGKVEPFAARRIRWFAP